MKLENFILTICTIIVFFLLLVSNVESTVQLPVLNQYNPFTGKFQYSWFINDSFELYSSSGFLRVNTSNFATTCNIATQQSVYNGTHFVCAADAGGTDTIWNITDSNWIINDSDILDWNESKGNLTFLRIDGTNNMTDNFNVGGNNITNLDTINATTYQGISFEEVEQINNIGDPTHIDTLQELYNHFYSAGVMHECNLTKNNNGSVNISEGFATLRKTNDSHTTLISVEVSAQNNIMLTNNSINYVYLDYNAGTPQWIAGTSLNDFNCQDKCVGYIIVREGNELNFLDVREQNVDSNRKLRRKLLETEKFIRVLGGSVIGSSELNITLTAGAFYFELSRFDHSAFDTGTDNFSYYYTNDSGTTWFKSQNHSVDNINYNDITSGLTALGTNKYKVDWVYVINNKPSSLAVIYGQEQFTTLAGAEASNGPSTVSALVDGLGALVGRLIIQQGVSTMTAETSFGADFTPGAAQTHNGLSGLDGGTTGEYYHFTSAQHTELTSWSDTVILSSNGNLNMSTSNLTTNILSILNPPGNCTTGTWTIGWDGLNNYCVAPNAADVDPGIFNGDYTINGTLNITDNLTINGGTITFNGTSWIFS